MARPTVSLLLLAGMVSGCGPSDHELRERTISTLNTEADKWDGGQAFQTAASDAFGRPVTSAVEKRTLDYVLAVRSNGPDGLPKNSDDIVISRSKRHGETSLTEQAEKAAEGVSRGAASGIVDGLKKGVGLGPAEKKD